MWLHLVQSASNAPWPTQLLDLGARSTSYPKCTMDMAGILPHIHLVSQTNQQREYHRAHTFQVRKYGKHHVPSLWVARPIYRQFSPLSLRSKMAQNIFMPTWNLVQDPILKELFLGLYGCKCLPPLEIPYASFTNFHSSFAYIELHSTNA